MGEGIRASGVARKEIFVTSKLWNTKHHPDDVEPACRQTLADLGICIRIISLCIMIKLVKTEVGVIVFCHFKKVKFF